MMFFLYTVLSILGHFLLAPFFLVSRDRRRKYLPSFRQRCGFDLPLATSPEQKCFWVHTVSMGEFLAARGLIQRLRAQYPQVRVVLSTITLTGNALARKHFPDLTVFFFPLDWGFIIQRFLKRFRPELFLCIETEIWPNFYRLAHQQGCRIALVNGRISPKSFRHYRYMGSFFRKIASRVDLFLMQSPDNADRLLGLGVPAEKIVNTGNLKYDLHLESDSRWERLLGQIGHSMGVERDSPILICGSTMPGEEPLLLKAFHFLKETLPNCRLILAPRHPERFDEVAALLSQQKCPFIRRSQMSAKDLSQPADILLLDSVGELAHIYHLATIVFIGGSLVDYGGHNILEPAFLGKAILIGPHMRNFQDIATTFLNAGAVIQVVDIHQLQQQALRLLSDSCFRIQLGERAAGIMKTNGGALERTMEQIRRIAKS